VVDPLIKQKICDFKLILVEADNLSEKGQNRLPNFKMSKEAKLELALVVATPTTSDDAIDVVATPTTVEKTMFYQFDKTANDWKERGVCFMKIFKNHKN